MRDRLEVAPAETHNLKTLVRLQFLLLILTMVRKAFFEKQINYSNFYFRNYIYWKYNKMFPLYTIEEFENSKPNDKLKLKCLNCNNVFEKRKTYIISCLNRNDEKRYYDRNNFCSLKCLGENKTKIKTRIVECGNCGKKVKKNISQIRSKNNFCTKSCAVTYNNKHKTKGNRTSKLERWLSEQLKIQHPNLEIHYNRKDAINSELDIYIPSLKLAFELNGIFHYEPIYGRDKLKQIQNNDDRKFQACLERNIELVIIDSSSLKYWKPDKGITFLNIINEIINQKYGTITQT